MSFRTWFTGAAAAALLAATPVIGQTEQTPADIAAARAATPDFVSVWVSYLSDNDAYYTCVEEQKTAALSEMWRRRAPLESALIEISVAYRGCPGFDAFWNTVYFSGYDSPEAWILDEIQAAKAAVLAQAEIDAERVAHARDRLARAAKATRRLEGVARRARIAGRNQLSAHVYALTVLAPDTTPSVELTELIAENGELLAAILPEEASESASTAVELSESRDSVLDLAEIAALSSE